MSKREIPELMRFVLDNSEASSLKASLKDATADMSAFLRTVESSTQALNYYQTSLKKISTGTGSEKQGLYKQEIIVNREDSANVRGALDAKRAELEAKRGFEYGMHERVLPTVSGYKTLHGKEAFKEAQSKLKQVGGDIWKEPTKKNPDRTRYFYPFEDASDKKAKSAKTSSIFSGANKLSKDEGIIMQAKADAQAKREEEKQKVAEEKKAKQSKATLNKVSSSIKKIIGVTAIAVDILRRILTASLKSVSQMDKSSVEGRGVGLTATETRAYSIEDISHGLSGDATLKALQAIQSMFGDITNLDTDALSKLAIVMGGKAGDLAQSGIGGEHPEQLLIEILNSYFDSYKQGKNVVGQTVGREEALRSLTTALAGVAPELSLLFSRMIEDFITGAHGDFSTAEGWYGVVSTNRTGLTKADTDYAQQLSAEYNEILAMVEDLKTSFFVRLSESMGGILDWIKNLRVGMSATESLALDSENRVKNEKAINTMTGALDELSSNTGVKSGIAKAKEDEISGLVNPSNKTSARSFDFSLADLAKVNAGTMSNEELEGKGIDKKDFVLYRYMARRIARSLYVSDYYGDDIGSATALAVAIGEAEDEQKKEKKVGDKSNWLAKVNALAVYYSSSTSKKNTLGVYSGLSNLDKAGSNFDSFTLSEQAFASDVYADYLGNTGTSISDYKNKYKGVTKEYNKNKNLKNMSEEEKDALFLQYLATYILSNGQATDVGSDWIKRAVEQKGVGAENYSGEQTVNNAKAESDLLSKANIFNTINDSEIKGIENSSSIGTASKNNPTILNVNLYDKDGRKINTLSTGIDFGTTSNQSINRLNPDYVNASNS